MLGEHSVEISHLQAYKAWRWLQNEVHTVGFKWLFKQRITMSPMEQLSDQTVVG